MQAIFDDGPGRDRTCDLGIKSPASLGACFWLKHLDSGHLREAHSCGSFWTIWAVAAPENVAGLEYEEPWPHHQDSDKRPRRCSGLVALTLRLQAWQTLRV